MGIHDRDYIRGSSGRPPAGFSRQSSAPMCFQLIVVTVAVYVLDLLSQGALRNWLALDTHQVTGSLQIWRLLTYAFCHDLRDIWHILINMWVLWMFGKTMESMYGSREFLLFYLAAAVFSGLVFVGMDLVTGDPKSCVGASGATMAVIMLFAIHFPRNQILLFFVIPVEVRWVVIILAVFAIHPVLLQLSGGTLHDQIAHSAHLGGLLFGYLYWKQQLRLERFWSRMSLPRFNRMSGRRRNVRLYDPDGNSKEEIEAKVDRLLDKIHRQGEASLTDEEREFLNSASRHYRGR